MKVLLMVKFGHGTPLLAIYIKAIKDRATSRVHIACRAVTMREDASASTDG